MAINLNDYYSGGYFVIRARNPNESLYENLKSHLNRRHLLPDQIISVSDSIALMLSVAWRHTQQSALIRFGIPEDRMQQFVEWCGRDFEQHMDHPSMLRSVADARFVIDRFVPDQSSLYILGAGLHKELETSSWQPYYQRDDYGAYGIEKQIPQHLPLETGGTVLGYEVAGFELGTIGSSWLCNLLHEDMHDLFGIKLNQYGLIDTYEEAKRVLDWINEDPATRAEPVPYDVWLIVSYPLNPETEQ